VLLSRAGGVWNHFPHGRMSSTCLHMARDLGKRDFTRKNNFGQGKHHSIIVMLLHIISILHTNLFS